MIIENRGFTLIEISITLIVSFLIATFCAWLFLFIWSQTFLWQNRVKATNTYHLIMRTVQHDVLVSSDVYYEVDSLHFLTDKGVVTYHKIDGLLFRNGHLMNNNELTVDRMTFISVSNDTTNDRSTTHFHTLSPQFNLTASDNATEAFGKNLEQFMIIMDFYSIEISLTGKIYVGIHGTYGWHSNKVTNIQSLPIK